MDAVLTFVWRWLPLACSAGVLACLVLSLRAGRRQLLIDNLPTSKTSGVFMGLVELKGRAESAMPLKSQFAGVECVWFRFTVKERSTERSTQTVSNSDGSTSTRLTTKTAWTTIASITQDSMPFELQDDRGSIRVLPRGARVEPQLVMNRTVYRGDDLYESVYHTEVSGSDGVRQIIEEAIRLHSRIYVVGQARQRRDVVAAEIAADPQAPLFVISTRDEASVSRSFRLSFWGIGLLGLAIAMLGLYAWLDGKGSNDPLPLMSYGRLAAGYLFIWFAGWVVMLANSLIELRQRVRQAWANIDVELKRRADLLPQLVKIVAGLLEHEKMVQPLLAALRAQSGATAPGRPGPDPAAVSNPLRIVAEAYPALKAQDLFLKLQKQLAQTEERIALARGYFNDIATFFNTRLGVFPDGLLGGFMGMRSQLLMNEAGFMRSAAAAKMPGADTAGPCPQCHVDVRQRAGMKFCPFCGSDQLAPPEEGRFGHCLSCSGYLKPVSTTDERLAGNVLYCGHCRHRLVAKAPPARRPTG